LADALVRRSSADPGQDLEALLSRSCPIGAVPETIPQDSLTVFDGKERVSAKAFPDNLYDLVKEGILGSDGDVCRCWLGSSFRKALDYGFIR
jgi:hypothetical protein